MTTREAKHTVRLREWNLMVKQLQESGLTVSEWCSQHGLKPSCYYYRLAQLRKAFLERKDLEPIANQGQVTPTLIKVGVTSSEHTQPFGFMEAGVQFFHLQYKDAILDIPVGAGAEDIAEVLKAMAQYAV